MRLEIFCHDSAIEAITVVGLDWYNGQNGNMHSLCPNLAICYENGKLQLMCNESDTSIILISIHINN